MLKVKRIVEIRVRILIIDVKTIIINVGFLRNCLLKDSESDNKFPTTPSKQYVIVTFCVINSTGIFINIKINKFKKTHFIEIVSGRSN
jgi:hypothetical protein